MGMTMFQGAKESPQVSDLLALCQHYLDERIYFEVLDRWQELGGRLGTDRLVRHLMNFDWFAEFLEFVSFHLKTAGQNPNYLFTKHHILAAS